MCIPHARNVRLRACEHQGETFVLFKVPKCSDATGVRERRFLPKLAFDSFDLHGRARGCVCAQTPVPCCGLVLWGWRGGKGGGVAHAATFPNNEREKKGGEKERKRVLFARIRPGGSNAVASRRGAGLHLSERRAAPGLHHGANVVNVTEAGVGGG